MSNKIQKPRFQLERVCDDGSREEPELHSLDGIDADCRMGRRGFLLTSAVGLGALAALLLGYTSRSANAKDDKPVSDPAPASPAGPKTNGDDPANIPHINAPDIHGLAAHKRAAFSISFSPDSKTLFTAGNDGAVKLWSIPDGKLRKLQQTFGGKRSRLISVALAADGKTFVTGYFNGVLKFWRAPFVEVGKEIYDDHGNITDVAFDPNGKTLAVSMQREGVQLRSFPSGDVLAALARKQSVSGIAFSPDGTMLAGIVSLTEEVLLWSVPSGDLIARWSFPAERLVFSADGTLLVAAKNRSVTRLTHTPSGNTEDVLGRELQSMPLVFSPDGKWLAAEAGFGGVSLLPAPFCVPALTIGGHEGSVFTAAFSRDNRFLALGTGIGAVYVWELTGGKKIPCTLKAVLYDADSMPEGVSTRQAITSEKSVYIGPCDKPLPPGAVCTCNCVVGRAPAARPMCTFCTCVPVK